MNNRVSLESRKLECIKHVKAVEKRRLDLINKKKVVWINQWKCCHNILTHKRIYKHYTLMHKNTQTHTHIHTHTYIYIYVYNELLRCKSKERHKELMNMTNKRFKNIDDKNYSSSTSPWSLMTKRSCNETTKEG